jgi:hypothetical protein
VASKRVEDYAFKYGLSNRAAKKRMGGRKSESGIMQIARGAPVKGTGKKAKSAAAKK